MTLSGGMKRRVMIAKALVHEPTHPVPRRTLGRRGRGTAPRHVGRPCATCATSGVTVILTTHYIEEAEEMADRIGVINKGELILVEEKATLMRKLGRKELRLHLVEPLQQIPAPLVPFGLALQADGHDAGVQLRVRGRAHAHHAAAAGTQPAGPGRFATCETRRARSRTSSCHWCTSPDEHARQSARSTASRWRAPSAPSCRASSTPVLTTSLYFVVFGSAIGSHMTDIGGVPYGAFIVPGLIMLSVLTESIGNASFGIYLSEVVRAPSTSCCRPRSRLRRSCSATSAPRRPSP